MTAHKIYASAFVVLCFIGYGRLLTSVGQTPASGEREAKPGRVVSAVLAADEVLLELLAPPRLAGITALVDDPDISNAAGRVPPDIARHHGSPEEILRLKPDLVVVSDYNSSSLRRIFTPLGIRTLALSRYASFADIEQSVKQLGRETGEEEKAEKLVRRMKERLTRIEKKTAKQIRVLFYSKGGFTAGSGTLIDDMIRLAGGTNTAAEAGLKGTTEIPLELALSLKPDVLLLPSWKRNAGGLSLEALQNDSRWGEVPAVRSGRVYFINSKALESLSPYATAGVEEIAKVLHYDDADES